jgi:transcriptional regulator with XRE-family HTH domain
MNMLGDRIREQRIKKGFTQKQLAELIGAKHNSISDWENNKSKPDSNTIKLLMKALDVDANSLFGSYDNETLKSDATRLADNILNNPKISKMLSLLIKMPDEDLSLVIAFVERLNKQNS